MKITIQFCLILALGFSYAQSNKADQIATSCYEFLSKQKGISFQNTASMDHDLDSLVLTEDYLSTMKISHHQYVRFKLFDGFKTKILNYDGKEMTIVSVEDRFYSKYAVSGDFKSMSNFVKDSLNYEFPLSILFQKDVVQDIQALNAKSYYIGKIEFRGVQVHHLAFSVNHFSWQLYIAADENRPVPLKIIIADHKEKTQYQALLSEWDFSEIDEEKFQMNVNEFIQIK